MTLSTIIALVALVCQRLCKCAVYRAVCRQN